MDENIKQEIMALSKKAHDLTELSYLFMHTYHAHIYFSTDEIDHAMQVRENIARALPQLTYVGRLIQRPIGPHPMPMFEIHIPVAELETIVTKIDGLRAGHTVLIHPVQEDELDAHTKSAKWLGERLALDLSVL